MLVNFFGPNCKRFGIKRLEMVSVLGSKIGNTNSVLGSKVCVFCFVLIEGFNVGLVLQFKWGFEMVWGKLTHWA